MSKLTKQEEQIQELAELLGDDSVFGEDDYVFVLGPDGKLKTAMIPEATTFESPENVIKILTIFGMCDVDNMHGNATLH
jgi:hypothetical protein